MTVQRLRQFQWRLAAELNDDALGILLIDHIEDIFQSQRLEIEFVGSVVVSRDRFGIVVEHNRLEALFTQGQRGMHTTVIELNPLPNPVWTAAEDQDATARGASRFILFIVAGGVIWGLGRE